MRTRTGKQILAATLGLTFLTLGALCHITHAAEKGPQPPDGRELFTREWLPADARSVAGDGLGPMFNDTSCVACHNLGGIWGGGPANKNILMLTVVGLRNPSSASPQDIKTRLVKFNPAFASSRSTVLHRFSLHEGFGQYRAHFLKNDPNDHRRRFESPQQWRGGVSTDGPKPLVSGDVLVAQKRVEAILSQAPAPQGGSRDVAEFVMVVSPRNTTALFGAGLIDSIPEAEIIAGMKSPTVHEQVSGRVAYLKDGRVGRFGWKAQQAKLHDFTLAACAVELGLNVPGNSQLALPHKPQPVPTGLDMNAEQCDALVKFVSKLSRPVQRPGAAKEAAILAAGAQQFQSVGCADCHVANLGSVTGLYSDLLLHDMGSMLADSGAYGSVTPNSSEDPEAPLPILAQVRSVKEPTAEELAKTVGALRQEWRTPPLWGCRDSAPYMHDGRAETIEQAIAMHDGEAGTSVIRYFQLSDFHQHQTLAFLKSLVAPGLE